MIESSLFLGFSCEGEIAEALEGVSPELKQLWIRGEEPYLTLLEWQGKKYIGKWIGVKALFASLEQLQQNIASLLSRFLPHDLIEKRSPLLMGALPLSSDEPTSRRHLS